MSGAELAFALAIIGAIDRCFKYGKKLVEVYASFRGAETEVAERLLRVKNMWLRAQQQLQFLRRIAHTLEIEHQKLQNETLEMLASKLKLAASKFATALQTGPEGDVQVRRWRYVRLKQEMDKVIEDLDLWQKMFDPSWYLIMKAATPQIDHELLRSQVDIGADHMPFSSAQSLRAAITSVPEASNNIAIWLPEDGLKELRITKIPFCSADFARSETKDKMFILETVQCFRGPAGTSLSRDIRDLARKLAGSSPLEFGLLKCKGVVKHVANGSGLTILTIVFRVPGGLSEAQSLRSILGDMSRSDTLSDRVELANKVARSVCYAHNLGFVHKNVRPETILLLSGAESSALGSVFLVGYSNLRAADGQTSRLGDFAWENNLYRHPSRQGSAPSEDYVMQHDIYSLGVCLLEIGLWKPFVTYDETGSAAFPTFALGLSLETIKSKNAWYLKDHLQRLARGELKRQMGTKYSNVVVTCLSCLDPSNVDFGDESEFQDKGNILIGVRYIEKVIMQLNVISV